MRALPAMMVMMLAGLAVSECTASQAMIATGEVLDNTGLQFTNIAKVMDDALDHGNITKEQYRSWAVFAHKFQLMYPAAVQAWRTAYHVQDAASQHDAMAIIARLASEMDAWVALVATFAPKAVPDAGQGLAPWPRPWRYAGGQL